MPFTLLVCSDTHETSPAIVPAAALCWLHAGDFYLNRDIASGDESPDPAYAEAIGAIEGGPAYQWFKGCKLPIYTVRGNHDGCDAWGFFRTARDVTGRVSRIAPGLLVAGVGWHGRNYCDLPTDADFAGQCAAITRAITTARKSDDVLILLSHYPAYAPPEARESGGTFPGLRALAERLGPALIVQGHVHEWAGTSYEIALPHGSVLVVNPGPAGRAVTIDKSGARS